MHQVLLCEAAQERYCSWSLLPNSQIFLKLSTCLRPAPRPISSAPTVRQQLSRKFRVSRRSLAITNQAYQLPSSRLHRMGLFTLIEFHCTVGVPPRSPSAFSKRFVNFMRMNLTAVHTRPALKESFAITLWRTARCEQNADYSRRADLSG